MSHEACPDRRSPDRRSARIRASRRPIGSPGSTDQFRATTAWESDLGVAGVCKRWCGNGFDASLYEPVPAVSVPVSSCQYLSVPERRGARSSQGDLSPLRASLCETPGVGEHSEHQREPRWEAWLFILGGIIWTPAALERLQTSTGLWRVMDVLMLVVAVLLGMDGARRLVRRGLARTGQEKPPTR